MPSTGVAVYSFTSVAHIIQILFVSLYHRRLKTKSTAPTRYTHATTANIHATPIECCTELARLLYAVSLLTAKTAIRTQKVANPNWIS